MNTELSKGDGERNERGAAPCKCCKRKGHIHYPFVKEVDGLCYARCNECNYYDPYEFIGLSPNRAIENWNNTMEGKGKK